MKIIRYQENYKDECLRVFRSNIGTYFAEWESSEFEEFLDAYAIKLPYFVVVDNDEVVACGGYYQKDGLAGLSWGMVERRHHGESIGKALLLHRLTCIEEEYGNITVEIDTSQLTQGFFEKYGFIPTKVEKDGYKPGLDKVYMTYKGKPSQRSEEFNV